MFLTASTGSVIRFAIRTPSVGEQQLTGTAPLAAGVWSHVAVTLSGNTGTLYVNGTAVATNAAMTLRPSNLGNTTNNWLGRAQFPDPYFNGKVDEFRIYNRALRVAEISKLRGITAPAASTNVAAQAGDARVSLGWSPSLGATSYNVKRSTTNGGPYTTVATVNAAGTTNAGLTNGTAYFYVVAAVNALGESANSAQAAATPVAEPVSPPAPLILTAQEVGMQVKLAWAASSGATSYNVKRATTSGGPYTNIGSAGTTTFTDSAVTLGTTYHYVVSAVSAGEGANSNQSSAQPSAAVSAAYFKMDEASGTTTADESGNALAGTLINGPTRTTGRLDRAINFDGTNDHVTLPASVVSTLDDCTISAWVRPTALSTWTRVFDFGTGTDNGMFLTVQGGTGKPAFSIHTPSTPWQDVNSSVVLIANAWNHIAVTISGTTGTIYINGVIAGANGNLSLTPASLGSTTQYYLGRSQFPDPYFTGQMDEFQIRNRALTTTEISTLANPPNAPNAPNAPTGFTATAGNASIALAWSAASGATSYNIRRSTTNGGPYTPLATNVAATNFTDAALTPGTTFYYIITTQKTVAESANSVQITAVPLTAPEAWRLANFGTPTNGENSADSADPDNDGRSNKLEYATGTNPNIAQQNPPATLGRTGDNTKLTLTFSRIADPNLLYEVLASDDLASW